MRKPAVGRGGPLTCCACASVADREGAMGRFVAPVDVPAAQASQFVVVLA
jgi:hypothetical protein